MRIFSDSCYIAYNGFVPLCLTRTYELEENTNLAVFSCYLQKLPKAPLLLHLSLQQNNVESLNGLEVLRKTGIQSLVLKGNPVELDPHYRQQ